MKTMTAALVAAALLIPGTASSAFAGPGDGYPGTIPTESTTKAPDKVDQGEKFKVKAKVDVASDGSPCKGRYVLRVTDGDHVKKKVSKTGGDSHAFSLKLGTKGTWTIKLRFIPADNSPCKGSHDVTTVKVV
ncbi:hypothetical protein [Nocardioides sp. PD653-B2]|nr:hypothetical protein [Nocardioides sp. PD653-B2]GAW51807.1 uncharacterized protein (Precursor) [Nocardioides sp. PD653-B2]GAW57246.1 uncharacterized protein (Precursor) [Nocardioides sp. PD653]